MRGDHWSCLDCKTTTIADENLSDTIKAEMSKDNVMF